MFEKLHGVGLVLERRGGFIGNKKENIIITRNRVYNKGPGESRLNRKLRVSSFLQPYSDHSDYYNSPYNQNINFYGTVEMMR